MSPLPPAGPTYLAVWRLAHLAVAVCLLLFPLILAPRPSLAAGSEQPPNVRLSVSVAQPSYPRDALVRVTVRMRNVSHVPVLVGSMQAVECAKVGPSAAVLSEDGTQVYPPAPLGGLLGSCGPYGIDNPAALPRLLPGRTMTRHPYVILRGPTIEATGSYYGADSGTCCPVHVTSRPISVSLYDAPKPALTLTTSPTAFATITPPTGAAAGTMRMVYQWLCPYSEGAEGTGHMVNWVSAKPDAAGVFNLQPGCVKPYQWHVIAGFPNQPVVHIDYCRPSKWGC